jgi:hypothetical protein
MSLGADPMLGNAFIVSLSLRSRLLSASFPPLRLLSSVILSSAPRRGVVRGSPIAIQERFEPSLLRMTRETSWIPAFNQERPDRLG